MHRGRRTGQPRRLRRGSWQTLPVTTAGTAAQGWARALEEWHIPPEILATAPESPWSFPPALFAFDDAGPTTPTHARVLEALPQGGTLLDVGAGGGGASLPAAGRAVKIVAVDQSEAMLAGFAEAAERAGVAHGEVVGGWPDVACEVEVADVVVCANVVYNVADLVPFLTALGEHARCRVVVEASQRHPLTATAPLWDRFHPTAPRPQGPRLEDLLAVLAEMGVPVKHETFSRHRPHRAPRDEIIPFIRRRLCVGAEHDPEIDAWLGDPPAFGLDSMATLWWDPPAGGR